jgi:uncharacterized membrane protein
MSDTTPNPSTADSATNVEPSTDATASDNVDTYSDGAYTLVVAAFDSEDDAKAAYGELKDVEDKRTLQIEGVVIIKRDDNGEVKVVKVTDHSTRTGLAWGVLGGVVVGVLFPASVIGSALVGGAAGAIIGKARNVHHKHEIADQLIDVVSPGQTGLVALISDPRAVEIQEALAKASDIVSSAVDDVTASELQAAAKEVQNAED